MVAEGDFASILAAARLGAEWAWAVVYRDLSPTVLRYLRAHGAREPEDVLGDVFVQVVRKFPDFSGDERDFRAWVFTIARNRLTDEWRRDGRRPVDYVTDEVLSACTTDVGNVEDEAMRKLDEQRVRSIIEQLSPDQRDVLFLRLLAGFTIDEVAVVIGKKPGAVKALQARGVAAIRREISRKAVTL